MKKKKNRYTVYKNRKRNLKVGKQRAEQKGRRGGRGGGGEGGMDAMLGCDVVVVVLVVEALLGEGWFRS